MCLEKKLTIGDWGMSLETQYIIELNNDIINISLTQSTEYTQLFKTLTHSGT